MKRIPLWISVSSVSLWWILGLVGCADRLFLFPSSEVRDHPSRHGYACVDLSIPNERGNKITAWLVRAKVARKGTVVIAHGNGGNMGGWLDYPFFLADAGYDAVLFDYQGYGNSEGSPRISAIGGDVRALLKALRARSDVDTAHLALYGVSFGTAPSIVAANRAGPVQALVLEGSYVPFRQVYRTCGGCWPMWPAAWLLYEIVMPSDVDVERELAALDAVPALFISGEADRTTPVEGARALYAIKKGDKEIWTPPGIGHVPEPLNGRFGVEYRKRVLAFLDRCLAKP